MSAVSHPHIIHVWVPNLFGFKGGIQVYSAYLLQALQQLMPYSQIDVFIMHDVQGDIEVSENYPFSTAMRFHFSGGVHHSIRNPAYAAQLVMNGLLKKPNLVITTHLNFTPVAHLLKKMMGIPYWAVAHGIEAWDIKRSNIQAALRHANKILPVSQYTANRLITEQSLSAELLSVLPNTVNAQRFTVQHKPERLLERYGLSAEQPVILTVNRLCATDLFKAYDQILTALPAIRERIPDVRYIIVGKGADRPRLEVAIRQANLEGCVILAGFVPDDQLADYYRLCNVFAMPSKLEGFGIVYLEALACGKPTLGGNQDGAVDALCNGKLGALVNPDDSREIAQVIVQILNREYPNPLIYEPHSLRQAVINTYGFNAFKQKLLVLLTEFFKNVPPSELLSP